MVEDDSKTLWCGNLSEMVTEELLYELFLQAGPLEKVRIPRERDGRQRNFAFITFNHEVSVPYALSLFQGTHLFGRSLTLQCRNQSVSLPPPIRCSSDPSIEFSLQSNIRNQFSEMTDNFMRQQSFPPNDHQRAYNINSHGSMRPRHHPYRKEEKDRGRGGNRWDEGRNDGGGGKHYSEGRGGLREPWEGRRDGRDHHRHRGGNRRNR